MKALVDFQRGGLFGVGAHGDGRAVRIRAGNHQHLAAAQALVAGEDIRRQIRTGQVADVDFGIGVRPGNSNKNGFRHSASPHRVNECWNFIIKASDLILSGSCVETG